MSSGESRRKIPRDDELEKIASIAAEKAALIVSKGVLAELRRIRETLESIESELREIRDLLRSSERREEVSRKRGREEKLESLLSLLRESKYVLASDASRRLKIGVEEILRLAYEKARVLEASGDIVVMSDESYREFKSLLEKVKSSDPSEASSSMGAYSRLFDMLRRAGLVYYDYKRSSWTLLES
ncbi:MAG: hypothetical protein QXS85_02575 [Acidilobaceae archaeon]